MSLRKSCSDLWLIYEVDWRSKICYMNIRRRGFIYYPKRFSLAKFNTLYFSFFRNIKEKFFVANKSVPALY